MQLPTPSLSLTQKKTTKRSKRQADSQRQLRYLTGAIALEETVNPHLIRHTMLIVSAAVMGFIVWASLAHISEVSRAYGEIVPASSARVVQHLDGGMVKEIDVVEHQLVQEGDLMFVVDGTGASEDVGELQTRQSALALQIERLHAQIDGRQPDFTAIAASDTDRDRERATYDSVIASRANERAVLRDQLAQKEQSAQAAGARANALSKNMGVAQSQYSMLSGLKDKQLITTPRYLESLRQLNETQGNLSSAVNEQHEAQAGISEYGSRLSMLDTRNRNDDYTQLSTAENEYAQNGQHLAKLQERAARREVRSPATGYVKGLKVTTLGSVVQPGEVLAEIVPANDQLIGDVHIRPQDIGLLKIGQPVRLKVSAYDFSRFGAINGRLTTVSASTFTDEHGEKYYRGRIEMDQPAMGTGHPLMPGMTIEADIVTGKKTVIGYLMKPVQVAMSNALSER